jgi:hypothetical protein
LIILLGEGGDQLSVLPEDLRGRIEYVNYLRKLHPRPSEKLRSDLIELGLIELSYDQWLKSPPAETPIKYLTHLNALLDEAKPSRDVPGLMILDSDRPVRYYRGRWVEPKFQSGKFLARRSQAYGAPLWCYVQLSDGKPERLIDFPLERNRWRGCDEAWRLQMAIDAQKGKPQCFLVRTGPGNTQVVELFSPVPMWARRRWDGVGEPVLASGCLFAYRFSDTEIEEELRFAREALWLSEVIRNEITI